MRAAAPHLCAAGLLMAALQPVHAEHTALWPARPPLRAACEAWERHVRDLLEQHRAASELDEAEFGTVLSQFYAARSYCDLGNPAAALAIYDTLPLRAVQRPLR